MANFPNSPSSGKNAQVRISLNDGQAINLQTMTKQSSYKYRGKTYTNTVYTLGTGKTLINMRPELQPTVYIDGIVQGLEITPGAADKVSVTAGTIDVEGVSQAVEANSALALTVVEANTAGETLRWNAIVVDIDDNTLGVVAGTPSDTLLDTYGDAAGQRPLVPADQLVLGWAKAGLATTKLTSADIDFQDREFAGVDYEILPNIGGCRLTTALPHIHAATIGGTPAPRPVKFSGYYLDNVMSTIGTAKEWSLSADSTDVSDETFVAGYKQSSVSGFSVTFTQLAADKKVINAVFEREGHCAIQVLYPNGYGWQSAATVVPNLTVNPTSMSNISVTCSLLDFPAEVA